MKTVGDRLNVKRTIISPKGEKRYNERYGVSECKKLGTLWKSLKHQVVQMLLIATTTS